MRGLTILVALFGIAAAQVQAAENAAASRYEVSGSATLALDSPTQSNSKLRLRATLTPAMTPIAAQPMLVGGRFAASGTFSAASLVCYNDTIFRDGFDGTGF